MSGQVYAAAKWVPIPTGPFALDAVLGGPIQSSDMTWLWWWSNTQIAAFNLSNRAWIGPFDWDGTAITAVSHFNNGTCLMNYVDTAIGNLNVFRTFSIGNSYYDTFTYSKAEYSNTAFAEFGVWTKTGDGNFGYDPKFPENVIVGMTVTSGPSSYGLGYFTIRQPSLVGLVDVGGRLGISAFGTMTPGGRMGGKASGIDQYGNTQVPFGYLALSGANDLIFQNTAMSTFVTTNTPEANQVTTVTQTLPNTNRTYTLYNSTWYEGDGSGDNPLLPADIGNFDYSFSQIAEASTYGGWIGPDWLMLTKTRSGFNNPLSFTYSRVDRVPGGATGNYQQPIDVSYNPLGDTAIEMAGFGPMAYAGPAGSVNWFFLAIDAFNFTKYNLFNYRRQWS